MSFLSTLIARVTDRLKPRMRKNNHPRGVAAGGHAPLSLYNTLRGTQETFEAVNPPKVRMYNCGPTVYGPQHIGNLSMFVFVDVLRRVLEYNGYSVQQVVNFTDVGHLVSDGDDGEDKMTKGLKRDGLALTVQNMKKLGKKYADLFVHDLELLNIQTKNTTFPYASEYIPAQIAMVQALEEKGYAYRGKSGVYYDTSRFPDYGKLGNINLEGLKEGARVHSQEDKRNPTDFLLWKLDSKLGWDSPWGLGFPGWHIECSAMARSILGDQIDIHTGGIEHIPVHHNNEIAQSEAATGKRPFSRFWLHRAHLQIEDAKIAKSTGNTIYVSDIVKKKIHPLAFRYLLLGAHYRTSSNFTWGALESAQRALVRTVRFGDALPQGGVVVASYEKRFRERINDDLDTPGALAILSELMRDDSISPADARATLDSMDRALGLSLLTPDETMHSLLMREFGQVVEMNELPSDIQALVAARAAARKEKKWKLSDELRAKIEAAGYSVEDKKEGQRILKR